MSEPADTILREYPSFAFLLNDPEVGPLLLQAVDPNMGFDAATFRAKLEQTNWWRTHAASARSWFTLTNTDPATAGKQRDQRFADIQTYLGSLGVYLSPQAIGYLTEESLAEGFAVGSATMRDRIATTASKDLTGVAQTPAQRLKSIAEREYLVPIDQGTLTWWTGQLIKGSQSEDTFRTTMSNMAAGKFLAYQDEIRAGLTPGALFAPLRQTIADELELGSPEEVDLLRDPRWAQVTGVAGSDGKVRPMTLAETIKLARSDERWKGTMRGKAMGASLTQSLLKDFGAVA